MGMAQTTNSIAEWVVTLLGSKVQDGKVTEQTKRVALAKLKDLGASAYTWYAVHRCTRGYRKGDQQVTPCRYVDATGS